MPRHRHVQQGPATNSPASEAPKKYRLDSRLSRGLDEQQVAELVERFRNSLHVRQAIAGVLTNALDHAILQSESRETFESPNALAVLSDLMGYRRGLREALSLILNQEPT